MFRVANSKMTKFNLYKYNGIYNADGFIPGQYDKKFEYFYKDTEMYYLTYFGLNDEIEDYSYFDAFILTFKTFEYFNMHFCENWNTICILYFY